jgi:ubiquinone/menaquinone biosynthesis C-methylase UbiE
MAVQEMLPVLRAPGSDQPLACAEDGRLTGAGNTYAVSRGIPVLLDDAALGTMNRKYQRFYDRMAVLYQAGASLTADPKSWRTAELLGDFDLPASARVLETSIGTGNNLRYLAPKFPDASYWGMDLSLGMLRRCAAFMRRKRLPVLLCQANAEALPYASGSFDFVFHVGGINFFDNKGAAVREMTRVAKPGSRIVIVDETAKWVKGVYQKLPGVANYYREMDRPELTQAPVELLPADAEDINLALIWKGGMYKLSYTKPA